MRHLLLQAGRHSDQCNSSLSGFENHKGKDNRRKSVKEFRRHGIQPLNHILKQWHKVLKALRER